MAGVRQHIIPQFLLKGFASRTTSKAAFTWVYRKRAPPFETNIINVTVEGKFYDKDAETSADDLITDLESEFAPVVDNLRRQLGPAEVGQIPSLIAHLIGRTKHLRANVYDSTELFFSQFRDHCQQPGTVRRLLLNHPEWIEEKITELLKSRPIPKFKQRIARHFLRNQLLAGYRNNDEFLRQRADELISTFQDHLPQIIKGAHIDTLLKSAVPEIRVRWYQHFKWFVTDVQGLILPDAACLFECEDGRFKTVNDENDRVLKIYLPLSSHRLLIGAFDKPESTIGAAEFNQIAAQHSYELFVGCQCSPDLIDLSRQIATLFNLLTHEELERLVDEAFAHIGLPRQ